MVSDTSMLYVALILPALFAGTLIIEGIYKILNNQNGIIPIITGFLFIGVAVFTYFFILR